MLDGHDFVKDSEICYHNRRDVRIILNGFWIKSIKSVDSTEEQLAFGAFITGSSVKFIALQPVAYIIISKSLCLRIEFGETIVGAYPEISFIIFQNSINRTALQSFRLRIIGKGLSLRVEFYKTFTVGTDPEYSRFIFTKRCYVIIAQTVRITGIVPVTCEYSFSGFKFIEASAVSPNPENSRLSFINDSDSIIAQTVRICGRMSIVNEFPTIRVEPVKSSTIGPNPEYA